MNGNIHTKSHSDNGVKEAGRRRAFTLIELLVVISIIAILASLLLPAVIRMQTAAKIKKARIDIDEIQNGILGYESDHGKYPISSDVINAAQTIPASGGGPEDFTYGGTFRTPTGTITVAEPGVNYATNNSQLMAVLLDLELFPDGTPTLNQGHVKNTQRTRYIPATMVDSTTAPGVGSDGVYRDPWGNPYVITIDANYDEKARDAFYRDPQVSADPNSSTTPKRGLNGLIPKTLPSGAVIYEANHSVMVWSAGPDKMIELGPANQGANRDNIVSWK